MKTHALFLLVFFIFAGCIGSRSAKKNVPPDTVSAGDKHDTTAAGIRSYYCFSHSDGTGKLLASDTIEAIHGATLAQVILGDGHSTLIAGWFFDSITLGPFTLKSAGDGDVFFAKVDGNGNYVWAIRLGEAQDDACWYIGNSDLTGICTIAVFHNASYSEFDSVGSSSGFDNSRPNRRYGTFKSYKFDAATGQPIAK